MRTPGRCTNLEGCWISASQRDVWLAIGEDFVCPNCAGNLTAPPRQVLSARALRKVAIAGTAIAMGLAAMAVVTVKVASGSWTAKPAMVAILKAPASLIDWRFLGQHPQAQDVDLAQVTTRGAGQRDPQTIAFAAPSAYARRLVDAALPTPGTAHPAPASDLLFTTTDQPAGSDALNAGPSGSAATTQEPAVAQVTVLSQASFVLVAQDQPPLVLPISFGRPVAPEDDAAPVTMRWRYHSLVSLRRSYFEPGPTADVLVQISHSPSFLR